MKTSKPFQNNRIEVQVITTMRILIAVMLILACAVFLIYALWRVAQDLVTIMHAPESPLSDRDDYDLAPNATPLLPFVRTANGSIDELHGGREQT
jgi:hypothetical protein